MKMAWLWVTFRHLRMRAVLLLALGRSTAAGACFDRLLELRPIDCHTLASQAHINATQGSFDKAVDSLRLLTQTRRQVPFSGSILAMPCSSSGSKEMLVVRFAKRWQLTLNSTAPGTAWRWF